MSKWLKRLAIVSVLVFPLAVIAARTGLINLKIAMLSVAIGLLIALLVFLVSMFMSLKYKNSNPLSAKTARNAMLLCLIPIIAIGSVMVSGRDVPQIHNISTDVSDPPQFYKIKEIRTDQDNPLEYDSAILAEVQQAAYPNVKTLLVNTNRNEALDRAARAAEKLGWDIVNNNSELAIIEASSTSRLWGFVDDIVIRVRGNQADNQTAIDLRSVSRVGRSDMGANAKRIEAFIESYNSDLE